MAKNSITIPKKAMYGIAPAIAITGLLLSKRQPGPLLLFFIGIVIGILFWRGFSEE